MKATTSEAAKNAQSIMDVPETHMSHGDKILYASLAMAGDEVWAYHAGPPPVTWNLWNNGVRIVLPPVENCWRILATQQCGGCAWWVHLARGGVERDFTLNIEPSHDRTYSDYDAWAARQIQSAINHCAWADRDPALLDGIWR